MAPKKTILEKMSEGPIIGDGGFVFALEKRGYVKAGPWTPEATVEYPEAVRQLHREFLRAEAVMQTFTFYASDDKLENRGNLAHSKHTGQAINQAACDIAREVASEGRDVYVAGGISQTPSYLSGKGKAAVQGEFRKQVT